MVYGHTSPGSWTMYSLLQTSIRVIFRKVRIVSQLVVTQKGVLGCETVLREMLHLVLEDYATPSMIWLISTKRKHIWLRYLHIWKNYDPRLTPEWNLDNHVSLSLILQRFEDFSKGYLKITESWIFYKDPSSHLQIWTRMSSGFGGRSVSKLRPSEDASWAVFF